MPRLAAVILPLLFSFLLLGPSRTAGQTVSATTGALNGQVADNTGAMLPGVTVTIASDALMGTRTMVTNGAGFFRFPAIPPGEYRLVFTRAGFRTLNRDDVHVGLGFTATLDVVLTIATLNESVTVERRSPIIDTRSTAIGSTFDANQLANLPGARNMFSILAATPAVHVTRFDIGGNTAAAGSPYGAYGTSGNNRPMVEGIDITGISGTGMALDFGSIDEVSVGAAAHSAEWPKPGVQMQFITKSGGNRYRGTLYVDSENKDWQSFNIDENQIDRGVRGGNGTSPRDTNRLWSYYDINADVGGYIRRDRLWWYFSFREQDVSARRVNFPGKPDQTRLTNYSGKATYQVTPNNKLVAYGQMGRNHEPNRLDTSGLTGLSATTAIYESEDATAEQLARGWIWKGEWNSIINDQMFFEIRAGQFGANRSQKPNGAAPRFEDVGTRIVRGGNRDWQRNDRREQVLGSFSYFKDGGCGSHDVRAGGEIYRTTATEISREAYPGNVLHVLRDGAPQEVYLFEAPWKSESGFWSYAVYGNDSWRVNGRFTLNVGLRLDRYRIFLPEQTHPEGRFNPTPQKFAAVGNVIDWKVLAPRVGAIFHLAGDGKTLLKVNVGKYWLNPGVETGFNVNPNSNQWYRRYKWSDTDGSGVWEEGEETGAPMIRGGSAIESLDPQLKLPFVREVGGSIERELFANVAIRSGVVWRGERQHFMRQNVNWPAEAFDIPVDIPDPGPRGTIDGGTTIQGYELRPELLKPPLNVVRNVPNSDSQYSTWDITVARRFTGRGSLVAGFAHTWSRDQASGYLGQNVRQNTYPMTPNDLINAGKDGRYEFRVWSAKIHGTYEGRWGVRVTPMLRHQSGQPFGRTFSTGLNYANVVWILAEPIGTRRMDNITIFDVRVEKGFRLTGGRRVAAFVDIYNMLNANPEENTSWSSESFLRPLSVVAPRIARVGAKLQW
jgi:hypothetical protein